MPACGELFVLEMGEPVRIVELAETMIRLSGLEPERDIAVEIVGARPGKKLHEDLFNPHERPSPRRRAEDRSRPQDALDPEWVEQTFTDINLLVLEGDSTALAKRVDKLARGTLRRAIWTPVRHW